MKTRARIKNSLIGIVFILSFAVAAAGQGVVSWQQAVFTADGASGPSSIVKNINQSSHVLSFCATTVSGTSTVTIWLEQSGDGVHWTTISPIGSYTAVIGTTCNTVSAGGYYSNVRANKTFTNPGGTVVNAWYSAATSAVPVPNNLNYTATTNIGTFVPIDVTNAFINFALKSTPVVVASTGDAAVYGASVYNPNGSLVYFYIGNSIGAQGIEVVVPAGQTLSLSLPPQGVLFRTASGFKTQCSTSPNSNVDPTTGCVVNILYKYVNTVGPSNEVPN